MNDSQKKGALIFFGKGKCSQCHAVGGQSNEMFSDFKMHNIGVPQIAPFFGVGRGNVIFDGPNEDEDFGLEQITGNSADRYKFRSSPLRNARFNRRSSTTERSPESRMPFATTLMLESRCATTMPRRPAWLST